jgi:hypothetical protein
MNVLFIQRFLGQFGLFIRDVLNLVPHRGSRFLDFQSLTTEFGLAKEF